MSLHFGQKWKCGISSHFNGVSVKKGNNACAHFTILNKKHIAHFKKEVLELLLTDANGLIIVYPNSYSLNRLLEGWRLCLTHFGITSVLNWSAANVC